MKRIYTPSFILGKMKKRADAMTQRVLPYLQNSKMIIDVGSGNCFIAKNLQQEGKQVAAVDIKDQSLEPSVEVTVFDGQKLPFKDKSFDTGLLLTVMHHTPSPEKIFQEVARVSKEIIVIETSYRNLFEKLFIVLFDSLLNFQLQFFWNSYRSDSDWKLFFKSQGYKITKEEKYIDIQGVPYFHPLYYLTRRD